MLEIELKEKNIQLESTITVYEQLICSNEGMQMLLEEYEMRVESLQSDKSKLEVMLERFIREERVMKKERSEGGNVYKALEEDEVDVKLAEELNARSDPQSFNSLFHRQSSGLYLYGSKQIFAKIHNGMILCNLHLTYIVRIGGSNLNLEEFIRTYGPTELEKINKQAKR